MNNCWFRVKTHLKKSPEGEIGIEFEHPTLPGNQAGGWMAREQNANSTPQENVSPPSVNTSKMKYPMSEVKKHDSADSAWIVVHGHVYDCTRYLNDHPGGIHNILNNAGTDCTKEFDSNHPPSAKKVLEEYRIGEFDSSALSPNKIQCKLVFKDSISHDVRLFRFELPSEDQVLRLQVGKHIYLCATIDDKPCSRAYTPTSTIDKVGYFELVVKIYFKGVHPEFRNGGLMSQYLDSLPLGATLDVEGPSGYIEYTGRGHFLVRDKPKFAKKLAMMAGGTGITPIYQIIQAVLNDPEDDTEMYLVYANHTEADILLREKLDDWARKHERRLRVWYVVSKTTSQEWKYSLGHITEDILKEHIPPATDTLALACGPPQMIELAVQPNLEKLGYDINNALLVF